MHIVTAKRATLFRPCSIDYDTIFGIDVSALYDEVLLICPDELANDDPIELDLDGPAQQEIVHIVLGDEGSAHVEPYWVDPDKSALKSWEMFRPGPAVVNIGALKTPPEGMFSHNDIFLPLWDALVCKEPEQMTELERFWYAAWENYPSHTVEKVYQQWKLLCGPENELTDDKHMMLDITKKLEEQLAADKQREFSDLLSSSDTLPY